MKNGIIITLCALVVLGFVAWGTYDLLSNNTEGTDSESEKKEQEQAVKMLQENRKDIQGTITEEELAIFEEKSLNPFGEDTDMNELDDYISRIYSRNVTSKGESK